MILIKSSFFVENLKIKEKTINTINFENKETLVKVINEIILNKIKVYSNDELLSKSKIDILENLYNIDLNKKDFLIHLYSNLEEIIFYNFKHKNELDQNIINLFKELSFDNISNFDFSIDYKIANLLKLLEVKHKNKNNFLDNFFEYINLLSKYNYKVFIVLFLNNYFNESQIEQIKKELLYNEITIINIETNINIENLEKYKEQHLFYFDNDNCYII